MKHKKTIVFIVLVAVFLSFFLILTELGLINNTVKSYPNSVELSSDVEGLVEKVIGNQIEDKEMLYEDLNIDIRGTDNLIENIVDWYNEYNNIEGWEPYFDETISNQEYNIQIHAWKKNLGAKIVIVADGQMISTLTSCDTLIITSHAPLWIYDEYLNQL